MKENVKFMHLNGMAYSDIRAFISSREIGKYIETKHRTKRGTYEPSQQTQKCVIIKEE